TPRRKPESLERDFEMTYVPLDQLLKESDFVSVHSPLKPETVHQIGSRELALMKPNAYLINTARGAIVDATALARALTKRQIAGAGLDVFEREPKVTPALLKMPNVVTTPHLGSAVAEVREQMANIVVDNILAFLAGKMPPNCINPEVLRGLRRTYQGVAHAPSPDRGHRQPISLARSGESGACAHRSRTARGQERVRR